MAFGSPNTKGLLRQVAGVGFIALFGVIGGDLAKSVTYGRWFRFPLAEVLAAAPLDRALSFGAALLVGVVALTVAVAGGGLHPLSQLTWPGATWVAVGLPRPILDPPATLPHPLESIV